VDLNNLWFVILAFLLAGYAVLDGFDLGVGILIAAVRGDRERRLLLNSIGPHWDGNEVWLITFGAAMFAAFPNAYAAVFSGFYTAFMLLLFALIFRAVAIEFRGKRQSEGWRIFWDGSFCAASLLATLLFGVAAGNIVAGIPVNDQGLFVGGFATLIPPYPILIGLLTVFTALMHGATFLYLKTEGHLQEITLRWVLRGQGMALIWYVLTGILTWFLTPGAAHNLQKQPWCWGIVILILLAFVGVRWALSLKRPLGAFLCSSLAILGLIFLFAFSLYPNLVISSLSASYNLNIFNAASSAKTLKIMAIIAFSGMPLVLFYTIFIYRAFRGKVRISEHSY